MTDRCKNITLPQTSFAGGNNPIVLFTHNVENIKGTAHKNGGVQVFPEYTKLATLAFFYCLFLKISKTEKSVISI